MSICDSCGLRTIIGKCSRCEKRSYCSLDCQKQDWLTHKLLCNKGLEIQYNVDSRGSRLVTTRDFQRYSILLSEPSVLVIQRYIHGKNAMLEMKALMSGLDPKVCKAIHQLKASDEFQENSNDENQRCKKFLNILKTNGMSIGGRDAAIGGIFLVCSRINHSCEPNAVHIWNERTNKKDIIALKDIKAGEEVTIAYIEPLQSKQSRQLVLLECYGFECQCEVCALEDEVKSIWKERAQILEDLTYRAILLGNRDEAMNLIQEHLELLCHHRYTNPMRLVTIYYDAFQAERNLGSKRAALKWLEKAVNEYDQFLGNDHPLTKQLKEKIPNI